MSILPERISNWLDGLPARDRRALMLGLLILGPVLGWMAIVRPYRAALNEAVELAASEAGLLARERALLASAAPLQEALVLAKDEAARAEYRLVTASNTALAERELTERLESVAYISRVLLEDIRSVAIGRDETPPPGLRPVRLEVRGESDMQGVLGFLRDLETSSLLLRVAGMSLQPEMQRPPSRGRNDDDRGPPRPTGVVEFVMIVEAYAQLNDGGAAAIRGIEGVEK